MPSMRRKGAAPPPGEPPPLASSSSHPLHPLSPSSFPPPPLPPASSPPPSPPVGGGDGAGSFASTSIFSFAGSITPPRSSPPVPSLPSPSLSSASVRFFFFLPPKIMSVRSKLTPHPPIDAHVLVPRRCPIGIRRTHRIVGSCVRDARRHPFRAERCVRPPRGDVWTAPAMRVAPRAHPSADMCRPLWIGQGIVGRLFGDGTRGCGLEHGFCVWFVAWRYFARGGRRAFIPQRDAADIPRSCWSEERVAEDHTRPCHRRDVTVRSPCTSRKCASTASSPTRSGPLSRRSTPCSTPSPA